MKLPANVQPQNHTGCIGWMYTPPPVVWTPPNHVGSAGIVGQEWPRLQWLCLLHRVSLTSYVWPGWGQFSDTPDMQTFHLRSGAALIWWSLLHVSNVVASTARMPSTATTS